MLQLLFFVQHLLKLNKTGRKSDFAWLKDSNTTLVKVKYLWDLLNLLCLVYSNTTLVKVKFRVEKPAEGSQNNSNTTLVKVKFIYLKNFINFFLFKYNTC